MECFTGNCILLLKTPVDQDYKTNMYETKNKISNWNLIEENDEIVVILYWKPL